MIRRSGWLWIVVVLLAACSSTDAAATVNGDPVVRSNLRTDTDIAANNPQVARLLDADASGQVRADLRARVLTQRIEDLVVAQAAEELGVTVTEEDVEAQKEDLAQRAGGEQVLQQRLDDAEAGGPALDRLARSLATANAVEQALVQDVDVSEEELRAYHDRNAGTATVRHIVVGSEGEAERILERLRGGGDFAAQAQANSIDEDTAADGGRLGELDREEAGDQGGAFAEAVFDTDATGLLEPVRTFQGWHIIEVLARDPGPPLAQVEDEIRDEVRAEQADELYDEWVREHIEQAEISIDPSIGTWDPEAREVEAVDVRDAARPATDLAAAR